MGKIKIKNSIRQTYLHLMVDGEHVFFNNIFPQKILPYFRKFETSQSPFFYFADQTAIMSDIGEVSGQYCYYGGGLGIEAKDYNAQPIFQDLSSTAYSSVKYVVKRYNSPEGMFSVLVETSLEKRHAIELGFFGDKFFYSRVSPEALSIKKEIVRKSQHPITGDPYVKKDFCITSIPNVFYPHEVYVHKINKSSLIDIQDSLLKRSFSFQESQIKFPLTAGHISSLLKENHVLLKQENMSLNKLIDINNLPPATDIIAVFYPYFKKEQTQLICGKKSTISYYNRPQCKMTMIYLRDLKNWNITSSQYELTMGFQFLAMGFNQEGKFTNLTKIGTLLHTSSEKQVRHNQLIYYK